MQHVHFKTELNEKVPGAAKAPETVFEGNELHEINGSTEVSLLYPLAELAGFFDASSRVGSCRETLQGALNGMFDAFPSDTATIPDYDGLLPKVALSDHRLRLW